MSEEARYTYRHGSRPEGVIVYDDNSKIHIHHDSSPAHGQQNAFDLCRLELYGSLDTGSDRALPITERPSYKAMAALAAAQVEVKRQMVVDEHFEDLDATDTSWMDEDVRPTVLQPLTGLPDRIVAASSKLTDQENARRIQRKFGDKLLAIGKAFFYWTGTHWEKDDTQAIRFITRLSQIVKAEALKIKEDAEAKGEKIEETDFTDFWRWSVECGQKAKISNCESLLRSLLDFDAKQLNTAPHLLSCTNGTLDLRTGVLQPHDPKDFITACAPVAYDPAAEAPRFIQFLNEIHCGDAEIIGFVQRWFGYCITGYTNEHKVVFHVGLGGNGKGTTMETLNFVLGDGYYSAAPQKLLTLDEQGATPELASLLGRRMVTISETDENMEIRDGLVKKLTGADKLSARHLFKDPFEFFPTHKLQIFTNHAPVVKSQDFSMWRRIILLNYNVRYGDEHEVANGEALRLKDKNLFGALKAEAPGILRWLVDGAREWFGAGLQPPPSVLAATQKYREDQDTIGAFARERLVKDPSAWTALSGQVGAVYPAYKGWLADAGGRPLGRNRFVREIQRVMKGTKLEPRNAIAGFSGFCLTQGAIDE